jgi:hypothetical protein
LERATNAALSLVENAEEELIATWVPGSFIRQLHTSPRLFMSRPCLVFTASEYAQEYRGTLEELRDPSESLTTFADYIYADSFWTFLKSTKSLKYNAAANSELDFPHVLSLRMQCREARDIFKSEKFQQRQSEDEWDNATSDGFLP